MAARKSGIKGGAEQPAKRKAAARAATKAPESVGAGPSSSAQAAPRPAAAPAPHSRSLGAADARLIRLSAAIALGAWDELTRLRSSAKRGEPNRAWREVVLQTHLFCGFPRVVEAYGVLAAAGGLGELEPGEARGEPDQPAKGAVLFEHVYRELAADVRATLAAGHPDFAAWIEGHAYGRVLARPGLGADRRELCAVAALAALGQDRQLASHVRGSLRCGATVTQVHSALDTIADLVDEEHLKTARKVVNRFAK